MISQQGWVVEPFIDGSFIDVHTPNVRHLTSIPKKETVVFEREKPYEGQDTTYFNVVQDNQTIYLFYRAASGSHQLACIAQSQDGFKFQRIMRDQGDTKYAGEVTNAFLAGHCAHAFFAFKDPLKLGGNVFKGIARTRLARFPGNDVIDLYDSPDGLNWKRIETIISPENNAMRDFNNSTGFDTLNNIVYDARGGLYRVYLRHNIARGFRHIQTSTSKDLLIWEPFREINLNGYANSKKNKYNIYVPNIVVYPDSYYFLGLPHYQNGNEEPSGHVSLIFSRDGENWLNPLERELLFPDIIKGHSAACGIVQLGSKFIVYVETLYGHLTAYSFRRHGIRYLMADRGIISEIISRPLKCTSNIQNISIRANFETLKEDGFIKFILLGLNGNELLESVELVGNQIDTNVQFNQCGSTDAYSAECRLKILFRNAKIYSLHYKGLQLICQET